MILKQSRSMDEPRGIYFCFDYAKGVSVSLFKCRNIFHISPDSWSYIHIECTPTTLTTAVSSFTARCRTQCDRERGRVRVWNPKFCVDYTVGIGRIRHARPAESGSTGLLRTSKDNVCTWACLFVWVCVLVATAENLRAARLNWLCESLLGFMIFRSVGSARSDATPASQHPIVMYKYEDDRTETITSSSAFVQHWSKQVKSTNNFCVFKRLVWSIEWILDILHILFAVSYRLGIGYHTKCSKIERKYCGKKGLKKIE